MLTIPLLPGGLASARTSAGSDDVECSTGFNDGRDGVPAAPSRPPAHDRLPVQGTRASDELLPCDARGTTLQRSKLLLQ